MELPISQEAEIPAPINTTYGHGHIIHHHHHDQPSYHNHRFIIPSSSSAPSNGTTSINPQENDEMEEDEEAKHNHHVQPNHKKKQRQVVIRYRECLKNHAAAMGGNATDGCGEFMPSGEEGTIEALTCSACNCHRNFHRKEIEGEPSASPSCDCYHLINRGGSKIMNLAHHNNKGILPPEAFGYPSTGGTLIPAARPVPIMPYNNMGMGFQPSESDEQEDGGGGVVSRGPLQVSALLHHHHHLQGMKKRFRTKFTQEQKEKMLNFAEKVGWKMQKQEEGMVQQFCQEIGVKRRVLKVWMHNNKHHLAKKNSPSATGN